jgi:flagellar motor switch/type III secretory pathway protein FliN
MATAIAIPPADRHEAPSVSWQDVQDVPCLLAAEISVSGFTVRDLLLLQVGSVVNSKQLTRGRVALRANGSFIAWTQFEVLDGRLGVRITDLD